MIKNIYETILFCCLVAVVLYGAMLVGDSRKRQKTLETQVTEKLETTEKKLEAATEQVETLSSKIESMEPIAAEEPGTRISTREGKFQ